MIIRHKSRGYKKETSTRITDGISWFLKYGRVWSYGPTSDLVLILKKLKL
jgi:hypothetical protein